MVIETIAEVFTRLVENSLLFGIEDIVLLVTVLGSILLMANDYRMGVLILFFLVGAEFVIFVSLGLASFKGLILLLSIIVVMALSTYVSSTRTVGSIY